MENQLKFIGSIHSSLKSLEDCPLQENESAPEAMVEIFPEFADCMSDLKSGDTIILFTWLHQADRSILKTKPRNIPSASLTGIFSTRSPDRPNPIGIHFVKVSAVIGHKLRIEGLEVLDQTPIVDIKPDLRR